MVKHPKSVIRLSAAGLLFAAFFAIFLAHKSQAQTADQQILLTWRAATYTPPRYVGKALPTMNSIINFSVDVLENGVPADLSKQDIYWYVNDELFSGGTGVQGASLFMDPVIVTPPEIRVQIGESSRAIQLPIVYPEAVVEAPYPGEKFLTNAIHVIGTPYFFTALNPSTLDFTWSVNGETASNKENPADLTVTLNTDAPAGSAVNIGLTITNTKNSTEAASDMKTLTLVK